jgi:hypothetical protein
MPNEFVASSTQTACSGGLTSGITAAGTAAKCFVLAYPLGIAFVGGALIGAGTSWALSKMSGQEPVEMAEAGDAGEPAQPG